MRDIYDSIPKSVNKDAIHTIDFFIQTRKNPQIRAISSAIARDPEGYSRLPRETFQQVFDRMENEIQSKEIEWSVIFEYFTKRGRPLTKDEIIKLRDEDRKAREDEETKRRNDEEAERRRLARLMEDLEDKNDPDGFDILNGDSAIPGIGSGNNKENKGKKLNFNDFDENGNMKNPILGDENEYDDEEYDDEDDYDSENEDSEDLDRGDDAGY